MENGIIKGTGNSRYLKSVEDFQSQYPTYDDFAAALANGELPIDLNGINPDGWQQMGTALTKGTLLDDTTETAIWGDSNNRTVNQALLMIAYALRASGGLIVSLTVTTSDGDPLEGMTISNLKDLSGNTCVTDEDGKAFGVTSSTSATLTASGFFDVANASTTVSGQAGDIISANISASFNDFLSITSTKTSKFSKYCTRVDVSCAGGGGGGAGSWSSNSSVGAGGGAGGHTAKSEDVSFSPNTSYTATIGSGGTGGTSSSTGSNGGTGGTSRFLSVSASGGQGGYRCTSSSISVSSDSAVGNGNGGKGGYSYSYASDGGAGSETIYSSITETKIVGGGGGGGFSSVRENSSARSGGSPNGGAGGVYESRSGGTGGTAGGGGGAGGYSSNTAASSQNTKGGTGGRGEVAIRMYH